MNFIVNLLILLPARIASYFAWAGPVPDQANDFVTTFNQVAGHG